MSELIDLDASGVIPAPKRVKIQGHEYLLPADIPGTLFVRMAAQVQATLEALEAEDEDAKLAAQIRAQETAIELHDELLAAFQVYNEDVTSLPFGLNLMVPVVQHVYMRRATEEDAPPTKPARKTPTRGTSRRQTPTRTSSGKPKAKTGSRSSR